MFRIMGIAPCLLLFVCAGDLLYLYYMGGWHEPIKVILYSEIGCLFGMLIFSIYGTYYWIRGLK